MPANYVLLEKITVGAAGAASVTFANIPQTGYTDLVIKSSMRTNGTSFAGNPWQNLSVALNTNTGNAYRQLFGTGAGVGSDQQVAGLWGTNNVATANTFSNNEIYIPNYTSSAVKSISVDNVTENNGTDFAAVLWAASYSGVTASVTSITLTPLSGSLLQFSTFYLYGVAAFGTTPVIAPKAAGGDVIDTDGTYWYHTFLSSGTFTPATGLTCDYLVIAGGGSGGGSYGGGGGGAGAFRTSIGGSALSLPNGTDVTVTVGAGGAGTTGQGANGSNSVFSTITSTGGGGGGLWATGTGSNGGSGGGGTNNGPGGTGTTGGNNGGAGSQATGGFPTGGGGGGAGAVGVAPVALSSTGGAGGAGLSSSLSGSSVTYAGGGGGGVDSRIPGTGGAGGTGGGGAGSNPGNGTAGTANTGGGGGGAGVGITGAGGNGGSGIVIIRYAVA